MVAVSGHGQIHQLVVDAQTVANIHVIQAPHRQELDGVPGQVINIQTSFLVGAENTAGSRVAGFLDFLLRRHLYDVAETLDAAKHCYRRGRRGFSPYDRMGRRDRRHFPCFCGLVRHHLLLDSPAFLGVSLVYE